MCIYYTTIAANGNRQRPCWKSKYEHNGILNVVECISFVLLAYVCNEQLYENPIVLHKRSIFIFFFFFFSSFSPIIFGCFLFEIFHLLVIFVFPCQVKMPTFYSGSNNKFIGTELNCYEWWTRSAEKRWSRERQRRERKKTHWNNISHLFWWTVNLINSLMCVAFVPVQRFSV